MLGEYTPDLPEWCTGDASCTSLSPQLESLTIKLEK